MLYLQVSSFLVFEFLHIKIIINDNENLAGNLGNLGQFYIVGLNSVFPAILQLSRITPYLQQSTHRLSQGNEAVFIIVFLLNRLLPCVDQCSRLQVLIFYLWLLNLIINRFHFHFNQITFVGNSKR
jgi:hypothetical protein